MRIEGTVLHRRDMAATPSSAPALSLLHAHHLRCERHIHAPSQTSVPNCCLSPGYTRMRCEEKKSTRRQQLAAPFNLDMLVTHRCMHHGDSHPRPHISSRPRRTRRRPSVGALAKHRPQLSTNVSLARRLSARPSATTPPRSQLAAPGRLVLISSEDARPAEGCTREPARLGDERARER